MPNLVFGSELTYPMTVKRRETFSVSFTVYTDATYATAYDLTDHTVFAEIRKKDTGVVYLDLLPTLAADPTTGVINIELDIPTSLKAGSYSWDMLLVTDTGVSTYLVSGGVTVEASITDGESSYVRGPTGVDLQDRIDAGYTRGRVMIPWGNTGITSTLLTSNKMGLVVRGHGSGQEIASGNALEGSHSTIYRGNSGFVDEMIKVRGSHTHWSNFMVLGNDNAISLPGKNSVGIWISKGADTGTGSGRHSFEDVTITNCTAGVKFASTATENNCDMSTFRRMTFRLCDKGFHLVSQQSMGHEIHQSTWQYTDNPASSYIYVNAGGDIQDYATHILSKCYILTLDQTNSSQGIGQNNCMYRFNGMKIDNAALDSCLVALTGAQKSTCPAIVVFSGLHIGGNGLTWTVPLMALGGGMRVVLENCSINPIIDDTIVWNTTGHTGVTSLEIRNSRVAVTSNTSMLSYTASDGNLYYSFVNNRHPNGTLFADYTGTEVGTP